MEIAPPQRPIGFAPGEISALVNEPVVSIHAEEAAFLWTQRAHAVGAPHYTLKDLAALDERVEAHVDGLRGGGEIPWSRCKANLKINEGPGEIFALSAVAFGAGSRPWMREALTAASSKQATQPGLVSALGWLDYAAVSRWIRRLLKATSPVHRSIGIRASAIHRRDPGAALASAVIDSDALVRASGLRAVGELKRRDLLDDARRQLDAADDAVRFWAAWALVLNGDRRACQTMTTFFERQDRFRDRALQLALRALPLSDGRQWVRRLASQPALLRSAVRGTGVIGDSKSIPWLIRQMHVPELARLAGEAFSMITGVDLAYEDLTQDAPAAPEAGAEDVADIDEETFLRWPSPELVERWWEAHKASFSAGTRYLAGKPIATDTCLEVLRHGTQRQRAAAALELALMRPEDLLFEVRSRGDRQYLSLAVWTS
jgi:uncharacterized protein (TIGR02270 family)